MLHLLPPPSCRELPSTCSPPPCRELPSTCSPPGVGEVSIWEFSGLECYYLLYDHFIGNTNCLHLVLYRLLAVLHPFGVVYYGKV